MKRSDGQRGVVLPPQCWIAERRFAWRGRDRRLAEDYEATIASGEAWNHVSSIRLLLRSLA